MISTGKKARKQFGTRVACKRAKTRRPKTKKFGTLPISAMRGTAAAFIASH